MASKRALVIVIKNLTAASLVDGLIYFAQLRLLGSAVLPNVLSDGPERTQQGGPILKMRSEDVFDRCLGPLRHVDVKLVCWNPQFVGQTRVIETVRFPSV